MYKFQLVHSFGQTCIVCLYNFSYCGWLCNGISSLFYFAFPWWLMLSTFPFDHKYVFFDKMPVHIFSSFKKQGYPFFLSLWLVYTVSAADLPFSSHRAPCRGYLLTSIGLTLASWIIIVPIWIFLEMGHSIISLVELLVLLCANLNTARCLKFLLIWTLEY